MRVKSKGFVRTALAAAVAASLFIPSVSYSLGMGNVQVRSALNQRLNAELELFSVKANDLANLIVKISTQALAGNLSAQAANFDYSIETRRGRYFLKLVSRQPVREPLLNFLIELEWPQGRLLKELAIFLDPPISSVDPALTAGLPPKVPVKQKPTIQRTRPGQDSRSSPRASQPRSAPAQAPTATEIAGSYGPVARGETLWRIADGLRPSGVSIPQMMQALYEANPRAFSKPGLDYLMAGVTLQVPSVGGATPNVAAKPKSEASPQVADEQVEVRLVPPSEQEVASRTVSLPGSASTEQEGGPARLRIASLRDLQAQVQTAQSDEPDILVAQTATAESTISDTSTESTVSDASIAAAESTSPETEAATAEMPLDSSTLAVEETTAPETPSEPQPTETLVQPSPVQPQQSEQLGAPSGAETANTEAVSTESAGTEADSTEPPGTEASEPVGTEASETVSAEAQTEPQAAVATVETSREQPSVSGLDIVGMLIKLQSDPAGVWDDIQRHPMGLPIAGGVFIVLLLLIAMVARRSRKSEDYTEIERDLALSAAAARANEATQIVHRSSAEQQAEIAARMRLQRVDFLIAGGSYQEAEKILRRALSENPFDLNIKEKMLYVYYKSGNADQFITVAESIRSQVDNEQSPLWQKVVKQGRRIYPGHPLFELTAEEDTIIFTPETTVEEGANDDGASREAPAESERGVVLDFGAARTTAEQDKTEDYTQITLNDSAVELSTGEAGAQADAPPADASQTDAPQLDQHEWRDGTAGDGNSMVFSSVAEADDDRAQGVDKLALDEQELQFDFDSGELTTDPNLEYPEDEDDVTLRFDIEQGDTEQSSPSNADTDHEEFDLNALSFDDDAPQYQAEADEALQDVAAAAMDESDKAMSLDSDQEQPDEEDSRLISAALDGDATQVMGTGDYVEIKLDLATAYLEMQDQAGAVSLLEEVVNEGSANQQTRARELLAQIGR